MNLFKWFGNKRLFLLLIGLIVFIALMGFSLGQREKTTWAESFVKDSVSFAQGLLYKPARWIAGFFEDITRLGVLYEENRQFKQMMMQYARDTARLNDLEAQKERLEQVLQFAEHQKQANNYIWRIAEVVSMSPDPLNYVVVINLGEQHGVRENMAVMTSDGLIGRIVRVSAFYSNVQLLVDIDDRTANSKAIAVTVRGKDNESFGIIESYDRTTGMLQMTKIDQNDELAVGDLIVTSGLGQIFPRGLVVGTVVSRKQDLFGITHTAEVQPAASLTRLREVFVVEVPEMR